MNNKSIGFFVVFLLCTFWHQNIKGAIDPTPYLVAVQEQDHSSKKDSIPYTDPDYYKHIPVETSTSVSAEEAESSFEEISSRYNSMEFNYDEDKRDRTSWWRRVQERVSMFLEDLIPDWNLNLEETARYVIIVLGLILFLYVIYRLLITGKVWSFKEEKEEPMDENPQWIEKKLMELDLKQYFQEALENKNYGLAIRYLHLINLKELAAKGRIEWHYKKTNADFLEELKPVELKRDFTQTIRLYEYAWYGNFRITRAQYERYQKIFNQFKQEI